MLSKSIYHHQNLHLSLVIILLTNILIIGRVDATNQAYTNRELLEYIIDYEVSTENNYNQNSANQTQILEKSDIAQNFHSEPIRVFPNITIPESPNITSPDSDTNYLIPNNSDGHNQTPVLNQNNLEVLILNSLTNSASRYPWIVYPTDDFKFSSIFNPSKFTNYQDFSFNFTAGESIINRINFAHFPKKNQFYWSLPGNRIFIETQGWQSGISYQGQARENESRQLIALTKRLWGMQAVESIPQSFKELTGEIDINQFSIQSIAAEVTNPSGFPTPNIIIDGGNNNSVITLIPRISNLGTGSTYNPKGGGTLFELLDADNAPRLLQTFPTSNLQPLLEAGSLARGTIISPEILAKLGFAWGNPLTGESTRFQPQLTSKPGIKIGQGRQFDNLDLLNILINPFLSDRQRDLSYLNSLYWVALGQRTTNIRIREKQETNYWQRFYFNYPHNRTLLQYDPVKIQATYTNVFSNPGFSLSLSASQGEIDELQTANTTIGMLMGGIFKLIHPQHLAQSLQEAKERFSQQDNFTDLNTKATPEQIRKINQLLNRTLLLGNRNSGLNQVSGTFTFPSQITPNNSNILQIRTGNHRRTVQFIDGNRTWQPGQTFISKADISNTSFGPLTFIGVPIPLEKTSIRPRNSASAAQVTLTNANGQQFVQNWSLADTTDVPINVRPFALAFDRIELSQVGQLITQLQTFNGYLYLPTLEFLWAGSSDGWNYSFNSGIWFNLNSNSAFNVANNSLGLSEPTVGIYANGALSYINTHLEVDKEGKTQAIISHIPTLRFSWNSAANSQNPAYLNFSYFFYRQDQNLNYSVAPAVIFVDNQGNLTPTGFFQGKLSLRTGLELSNSLEISDKFYYTLSGIKNINQNWSIGAYMQNFREINQGVNGRNHGLTYGLLIKHGSAASGNFWESRLGMSGDKFEVRFEGGWRF